MLLLRLGFPSLLIILVTAFAHTSVVAQQEITIYVGSAAGGKIDTLALGLAPRLEIELGMPVKIANTPGDRGRIAIRRVESFPGDPTKLILTAPLAGAEAQPTEGLTQVQEIFTSSAFAAPVTLFAPQGISPSQLNTLQRAARVAMNSPQFLAAANQTQLNLPSGGVVQYEISNPTATQSRPTAQGQATSTATTQLECRQTLGFLSQRLPTFALSELNTMRGAILAQDVTQAIAGAKSQGYTADNAIKAAMAQAREFDRVSRETAQCSADVDALGASDDDFLNAIRQGRAPANCNGIRNSCLCAGIVNRLSAVGTRALAAEMQCFARSGRW